MLALTLLIGCRVHAPTKACAHVMLGACVDPPAPRAECERGRARDLDDDSCATTRDTRDLARALGLFVDDNDTIACESKDDELVSSGRLAKIACFPRPSSPPPCPARTVREGTACAALDKEGSVELAVWAHAAAAELCAAVATSSMALSASEMTIGVEIEVHVPNNDLTQGFVKGRITRGGSDIEPFVRRIDDALRRLGGVSSASDVRAAATCRASSRRPFSVP